MHFSHRQPHMHGDLATLVQKFRACGEIRPTYATPVYSLSIIRRIQLSLSIGHEINEIFGCKGTIATPADTFPQARPALRAAKAVEKSRREGTVVRS